MDISIYAFHEKNKDINETQNNPENCEYEDIQENNERW